MEPSELTKTWMILSNHLLAAFLFGPSPWIAAAALRVSLSGNLSELAVSRDSVKVHEGFRERQSFPFDLLSDKDEALCRQFDVIKEKNMYGRKVMGIERSTFLIDAGGVLRQEWRKVKVKEHAAAVLEAVRSL